MPSDFTKVSAVSKIMSEWDLSKQEMQSTVRKIGDLVGYLSTCPVDVRSEKCTEIEREFARFAELLEDVNGTKIMWNSAEQNDANSQIRKMEKDVENYRTQYTQEQKRFNLLGGAKRVSFAGGSEAGKEALMAQRDLAAEGDRWNEDTNAVLRAAMGNVVTAHEEFRRQAQVLANAGDKLGQIQDEKALAANKMNRIWWRERRKVLVIWIVVALLVVGLSVFCYYVFK